MNRFLPLLILTGFMYGQDVLNLKSGEIFEGTFYEKLERDLVFKAVGDTITKKFPILDVKTIVTKNWGELTYPFETTDTYWFQKALDADDNKEYDKAISFYLRAIELNPDSYSNYYNLGTVYKDQGNYTKAIESYKKAIELNPQLYGFSYEAHNNLGVIYIDQGNYTKAIELYEKVIELDPDYASAYNNLGIAYKNQGNKGNYAKAIELYTKAIELDPDYASAYNNIGIVYNDLFIYTKAIEWYEKAIEVDPDYVDVYWNCSIARENSGDKRGSLEDLKKAAKLGHKEAQDWLEKN